MSKGYGRVVRSATPCPKARTLHATQQRTTSTRNSNNNNNNKNNNGT